MKWYTRRLEVPVPKGVGVQVPPCPHENPDPRFGLTVGILIDFVQMDG